MADELDMAFMDDLISQVDQKVDTLKRQIKTNGEEKVRRVSFVTFGTFDEEPKIDDVRSISSTSSVGEIREGRNAKKVDRLQRNTTRSKTLTHVRRRKPDASERPLMDLTEDIDLMKVKKMLDSPYPQMLQDHGWMKIVRAFPLQRNIKQGLVSNFDVFDLPVPPRTIPADNPNCVYRFDTQTWTILPEDNFNIVQRPKDEILDEDAPRTPPESPKRKLRTRSFKFRTSRRKQRLTSSASALDLPKISDNLDVQYGHIRAEHNFAKTEESPILRRRKSQKKIQIEVLTNTVQLPNGISEMHLNNVQNADDHNRDVSRGYRQATEIILEQERARLEKESKKKKRFTWHFG